MSARAVLVTRPGATRGRYGSARGVAGGARDTFGGRPCAAPRPPARPRARASPPPPLRWRRTLSSRASAEARSGAGDAGADAPASADGAHAAPPVALADLAPSAAAAVVATSSAATAASASDARENVSASSFVPTPDLLRHCEPPASNGGRVLKIAVLLSGGVDSSVALTLLKAAGHDVTAFYLQIWFQEDFRNYWDQCPWEDDLRVARGVCDALDVPLRVVPLTDAYWDLVVSRSIDEIAKGRTPNPDIWCNSRVKFGAFRDHLANAHPDEFDRVASGHYAATDRSEGDDGNVRLVLSGDLHKDQTYFLAHLSQQQLRHLCFPVGGLPKEALRGVARAAGLPNADRKDSQGICFLGKVKFSEFVAEHLGEIEGAIVELETGVRLGTHKGFWFHTIGQRSGLRLSGGPWYVAAKDVEGNVVYATREYYGVEKKRDAFEVGEFSWVAGAPPPRDENGWALGIKPEEEGPRGEDRDDATALHPPMAIAGKTAAGKTSAAATAAAASSNLFVKVRHGENRYGCTLRFSEDGESGSVVIERDDQGLAAGQFAVFYDGETCLGCGVIAAKKPDAALIARDAQHRTVIEGGVRRVAEDRKRAAERAAGGVA